MTTQAWLWMRHRRVSSRYQEEENLRPSAARKYSGYLIVVNELEARIHGQDFGQR